MINPPSWIEEDALGNPQKDAPCGGENGGEPTGIVSTYRAGSTIQVRWQEGVGHPGHFRIAVARERSELVDPPVTTTNGDGRTGVSLTAEVMSPLQYPVIADGLFTRGLVIGPQEEPFVVDVTLPDYTCEKCTLQVIQFMANHVPGFFYHHCADIRLVATDAEVLDASQTPSSMIPATPDDAAADDAAPEESGCSIRATRGGPPLSTAALLLAGLLGALRRRAAV